MDGMEGYVIFSVMIALGVLLVFAAIFLDPNRRGTILQGIAQQKSFCVGVLFVLLFWIVRQILVWLLSS